MTVVFSTVVPRTDSSNRWLDTGCAVFELYVPFQSFLVINKLYYFTNSPPIPYLKYINIPNWYLIIIFWQFRISICLLLTCILLYDCYALTWNGLSLDILLSSWNSHTTIIFLTNIDSSLCVISISLLVLKLWFSLELSAILCIRIVVLTIFVDITFRYKW